MPDFNLFVPEKDSLTKTEFQGLFFGAWCESLGLPVPTHVNCEVKNNREGKPVGGKITLEMNFKINDS